MFCLFAALLPTIQKSCRTAFALKCACMKEKYRCSYYYCNAVYVSHGLSMTQSDPKMQPQQKTYSSILHCPFRSATCYSFTFSHLADAFIQSNLHMCDLQCIHILHLH